MTPRVTVLLAVHDGEPYLRQCIESVLGQTFEDFEFLIVDDASTDGTAETLSSYGDERIRVLRNEQNLGQVPSLNRGLHEARGELVARIDADDWCRPTRLERQVALLDAEPEVGLVGTWMEAVGEDGRRLGWLRENLSDFVDFLYHTLIMRVYVSHPSAMYRRDPVLDLGGYDEATGPAEDKDLWRKLALERWDARIVPEPLVVYRLHGEQLSQTRAAYQRDVDGRSQERFLAELSPEAPVHEVRLLLAGDRAFWTERHDAAWTLRGVELVFQGARTRLGLDGADAERLQRLVTRRLLTVARKRPWAGSAFEISRAALRDTPAAAKARGSSAYVAALVLAPAHRGTELVVRKLGRSASAVPRLRALHVSAKRSRLGRLLYGKLVGGG